MAGGAAEVTLLRTAAEVGRHQHTAMGALDLDPFQSGSGYRARLHRSVPSGCYNLVVTCTLHCASGKKMVIDFSKTGLGV
jgi:hypothetical protein